MSILRRLFARLHRNDRGAVASIVALALIPVTAVSAVGIDGGRVWVERQRIQTAAEAGAMAAAGVWARTGTACDVTALGKVSENAGSDASYTCTTTGDRYSGVITVVATKRVSAVFAKVIGHDSTTVSSTASVMVGAVSSTTDVRPNALCAANASLRDWEHGGYSSTKLYTIGIDQDDDYDGYAGVCGRVPGNWAELDYDGGSNRTVDTQSWIDDGYHGRVEVGQRVSGDPGVPSPTLNLDKVLGKTIVVPVYDSVTGTGAGAQYHVSSFVGMEIVGSKLNGPVSGRNLTVRFKPVALSNAGCSHGTPANGVVTWRPCSLDGKGVCS